MSQDMWTGWNTVVPSLVFLTMFFALLSWDSKQQGFDNSWVTGGKKLFKQKCHLCHPLQSTLNSEHTHMGSSNFLISGFTLGKIAGRQRKIHNLLLDHGDFLKGGSARINILKCSFVWHFKDFTTGNEW